MAIRSLVLAPGEKVQLPANVTVTSIVVGDGAILVTDCIGLPASETYVCYEFNFAVSDDFVGDAALGDDSGGPLLSSITIGAQIYSIEYDLPYTPDGGGDAISDAIAIDVKDAIEAEIPTALLEVISVLVSPLENRTEYSIRFKTLDSLIGEGALPGIYMVMSGIGFPNGLLVFPVSTDCICHEAPGSDMGLYCTV